MYMRRDLSSVYIENVYIVSLAYMFGPKVDFDVVREMHTLIRVCYARAVVCVMCRLLSVLYVGFSLYRDSSVARFRASLDMARSARFRMGGGGPDHSVYIPDQRLNQTSICTCTLAGEGQGNPNNTFIFNTFNGFGSSAPPTFNQF